MRLNPFLNVIGTSHLVAAIEADIVWVCRCFACNDLRRHPALVEAIRTELPIVKEKHGDGTDQR